MKKRLDVRFTVMGAGGNTYFSNIEEGGRPINFSNFPPFSELRGSNISVVTAKDFGDSSLTCTIVEREFPQIPRRDPVTKTCFSERIAGTFWSHTSIVATCFNEGDYLWLEIPETSEITTREELRAFFLKKYYDTTYAPFMRKHRAFALRMKELGKEDITKKDILEHFDFPEVLHFPW